MSATPMPDYCKGNNLIPSSLALPPPSHLMMNLLAFKSVYQTGKVFRQLNPFWGQKRQNSLLWHTNSLCQPL